MDCTQPEFWEERYRAGRMPWDFQGVPPVLAEYLRHTAPTGTVLVPGCGSGYEAKAFHDHGWRPQAVDFSPAAVERARGLLGPLSSLVREADFFSGELGGPYDLIYERTFLCSLPPARWPDYARRCARVLRPGGRIAGFFYYGLDPDGPPFPLTPTVAAQIFERFELKVDRALPATGSLPLYAGFERWQEWELKVEGR